MEKDITNNQNKSGVTVLKIKQIAEEERLSWIKRDIT